MNIPKGRHPTPSPPVQVNSQQPRGTQPTPPPPGAGYGQRPDAGYQSFQQSYRPVAPSTSPHDINKPQMNPNMSTPNQQMGQQPMFLPQTVRQPFYAANQPNIRQPMMSARAPRPNMNNQTNLQYPTVWQNQSYLAPAQGAYILSQSPQMGFTTQQTMNAAQPTFISQPQQYRMPPNTPPYYQPQQQQQQPQQQQGNPAVFFQQPQQIMQQIPQQPGRPSSQPGMQVGFEAIQPQQQQQPAQQRKRERKPLAIVDPTTMKTVTVKDESAKSSQSSKSNTPPLDISGRGTPVSEEKKKETQAQFASQVYQTMAPKGTGEDRSSESPVSQTDTELTPLDQTIVAEPEIVTDAAEESVVEETSVKTEIIITQSTPSRPETELKVAGEEIQTEEISTKQEESVAAVEEDNNTQAEPVIEEPEIHETVIETEEKPEPKPEEKVSAAAAPVQDKEDITKTEAIETQVISKVQETKQVKEPEKDVQVNGNVIETEIVVQQKEKVFKDDISIAKESIKPVISEVEKKEDKPLVVDITNQVSSRKDKEDLKYKYREEPNSPIDVEAKKSYDRDFLLRMQFVPESLEKPDGLPQLPEVILDKPLSGRTDMNRPIVDFTPGYVKSSPRGPGSMGKRPSRTRGGERGPSKVIAIEKVDINLHHAELAWKPGPKKSDKVDDPEVAKTEDLYKKVRSILNKLTPQKFQTLVEQVLDLSIDTEERLTGVIDLVFEKAIDEPNFSVAYANMCKYLMQLKVPLVGGKQGECVSFRKLLLSRCQREFEKDTADELDQAEKRKEIDNAKTEEEKKKLEGELALSITKARWRSNGNIRFIGELFKLKMLTEAIMHDCLLKLLKSSDEDSLECLCRLLHTIGKDIDHEKAKPRMDQYFTQMSKIVSQKKVSSRVRFMLQDVIDLRLGNWVPRRTDNNPKTIAQIHQEMAKEAQEKQMIAAQNLSQAKKGPRDSRGPHNRGDETGWSTVSATKASRIDPSKMKISKQNVDENSIQLGPGGRPGSFGSWGRGSSGGSKQAQQENERPLTPGNRYAALTSDSSDARGRGTGRGMPPTSGRESPRPKGPPSRSKLPSRPSQEERQAAISAVRNLAQPVSQDSSREASAPKTSITPPPEKTMETTVLPDDAIMKKSKAIINEYLHINDLKEAIQCVVEIKEQPNVYLFVTEALNQVLERSQQARQRTGHLLHDVVKLGHITVDQYLKGLKEVLEFAEDMEIDIPKIWNYLGELMSPMILDNCVPLSFLKDACQQLVNANKAGKLMAAILHNASQNNGHRKVGELWKLSGLDWSSFLPAGVNVQEFLKQNELEFTLETSELSPRSAISMETIIKQLHSTIIGECKKNEDVFDWIEAYVSPSRAKEPQFIRGLMAAVCSSAITGEGLSCKVQQPVITSRSSLLHRYLDHQAELELQALYALQGLVHKKQHPSGLLRTFFDTLYDEDIISEDAFKQWESSKDPAEQEGKGMAVKSVVQFFTWLSEADPEPDGEQEES